MSDRRSPTDFYGAPELGALQRRTGVAAPSVQPTMSDLWTAQTTVSRADLPSAEQDRRYDAYAPIIDRLNQGRPWSQRYHNPFAGGANPDLYLFDETGSPRLKAPSQAEGEATIWGAVEAARAADPNAYADLPPSLEAFHGQIKTKAKGALRDARGVINRNESWAGTGVELAAGAVTGFRDQYQIMSMPIGGIGRNFATRVLSAGLGNMLVEAAEQPLVARERGKLDETLTVKEAAINIGAAGLFGSALQGAGDLAGAGIKAAVASDAGQAAVEKIGGAFADGRALAQRARSAIGANRMTSEEWLAAKVLDREADVADISPFVAGAGTEDPFDPRSWDVDPEPSVRDRPEEPVPSRALAENVPDSQSLVAPRQPEVAEAEAAAPAPVPAPSAELKANVRADATDDTMLSSVFVKPKAEPGFHIEDSHGDGHFLYSVFRDETGAPKGVVRFPATEDARNLIPGERGDYVTSYVDPAYRRQGIATRLYDQLRDAGHDVDQLSGGHDLTPDGAAFASNRRGRAIRAAEAAAEDAAPPRAEPIAGFDDPDDTAAMRQLDSLEHDLRQFLEEDDARGMTVQLTEDGEVINAADVLADLDLDDAAIDAARACL